MKKLTGFALAFFMSSVAMAQQSFDGFYGQVALGYETAMGSSKNTSETFSNNPSRSYPLVTSISNINTFTQNFGLGYTAKVTDKFLLGIGGDFNPISSSSANFELSNADLGPGSAKNSYKTTNTYNIFLTPGYAVNSQGMIYAKAGYSSTQVKLNSGAGSTSPGQVDSYNLNGFIVGAGYKQFIVGDLYGFFEGNYSKYQSKDTSSTSPYGSISTTTTSNLGLSTYNFLVGIGYKF